MKKLKFLITAGGTIVKIDDVRHIGNFSTGSFAAGMADAALAKGHKVYYLHAKNAKLPRHQESAKLTSFETFDDYYKELKKLLSKNIVDVVFLAAAVSDYGLKKRSGKISSNQAELTLHLFRLPKVIQQVKKWSKTPVFQVGFKLVSNLSETELIETAYKSGIESRSNLTIANDFRNLREGKRKVLLVTPESGVIKLREPNLAESILTFVEKRATAVRFSGTTTKNKTIAQKYRKEIRLFKKLCSRLSKKGLMPNFYKGSEFAHGSLGLRVDNNSFITTAKKANKKNLTADNIVLVRKVDWAKKRLIAESTSGKEASLNAVLVAAILKRFPKINAVVHTHSFTTNAPTTDFANSPGTREYALAPLKLLEENRIVNLRNHGLVAIGTDLEETVNYAIQKSI